MSEVLVDAPPSSSPSEVQVSLAPTAWVAPAESGARKPTAPLRAAGHAATVPVKAQRQISERLRRENPTNRPEGMSDGEVHRFLLLRPSGHEASIWFEYMVSCLLSSKSTADLAKLNPFVPASRWEALRNVLGLLLLRANRVGHANRVLEDMAGATALVEKSLDDKLGGGAKNGVQVSKADATALRLKLDACLTNMLAPRAYRSADAEERALLGGLVGNFSSPDRLRDCLAPVVEGSLRFGAQLAMSPPRTHAKGERVRRARHHGAECQHTFAAAQIEAPTAHSNEPP